MTSIDIVPNAIPERTKSSLKVRLTSPIAMIRPAETGTMLSGLAKFTRFSIQIFAPSMPIMP